MARYRTISSVDRALDCRAGGIGFDSWDRANTPVDHIKWRSRPCRRRKNNVFDCYFSVEINTLKIVQSFHLCITWENPPLFPQLYTSNVPGELVNKVLYGGGGGGGGGSNPSSNPLPICIPYNSTMLLF